MERGEKQHRQTDRDKQCRERSSTEGEVTQRDRDDNTDRQRETSNAFRETSNTDRKAMQTDKLHRQRER